MDFSNKLSIQELDKIRESFVANVSHELRTPLTVLRGYLEELIELKDLSPDNWPDSADWKFWGKAFDRMGQQVERMQQLVEDLLLLASIESAALNDDDLEEIDMSLFLDAMISDAKSISNNNLGPSENISLVYFPYQVRRRQISFRGPSKVGIYGYTTACDFRSSTSINNNHFPGIQFALHTIGRSHGKSSSHPAFDY